MWMRLAGLGSLAALIVGLGGGCRRSAPAPALLPPPAPETVARLRWLGKQRLAADTNAAFVMGIWNSVESRNLEAQTLDRLAVGLLLTNGGSVIDNQWLTASNQVPVAGAKTPGTNHPSPVPNPQAPVAAYQSHLTGPPALLRPLLQDLLEQESFVEVRQQTNQPGELAFAIRLSEAQARLWETNLAALLEFRTGSRVAAVPGRTNGWQLQFRSLQPPAPRTLELGREGEWTVVALGVQTNALAGELHDLIQRTGLPFARQPKDFWLYAELNLRRFASALSLGWDMPADLPRLTLGFNGNGEGVRMRGRLDFPKPLPADLGKWSIPTNLVHEPLVSFTALRGVGPFLSSLKPWSDLFPGAPPDQLFFWAENGLPFLSFCAARLPGASNQVHQFAERLIPRANPWLATNSQGELERSTNSNGLVWRDLPLMEPWLQSVPGDPDDLASGGLAQDISTNRAPPELFLQVTGPTNLVAYDWELTGTRVMQWLYFGQFFRLFLHHAQVPPRSAAVAWLQSLEFKLGNCATTVMRTGPAQLSVQRQSSLGFSAVELHLLADWLESPQFPRGLYTFRGPPETVRPKKQPHGSAGARTNSAPSAGH
jgi:hypothetical protein